MLKYKKSLTRILISFDKILNDLSRLIEINEAESAKLDSEIVDRQDTQDTLRHESGEALTISDNLKKLLGRI